MDPNDIVVGTMTLAGLALFVNRGYAAAKGIRQCFYDSIERSIQTALYEPTVTKYQGASISDTLKTAVNCGLTTLSAGVVYQGIVEIINKLN